MLTLKFSVLFVDDLLGGRIHRTPVVARFLWLWSCHVRLRYSGDLHHGHFRPPQPSVIHLPANGVVFDCYRPVLFDTRWKQRQDPAYRSLHLCLGGFLRTR